MPNVDFQTSLVGRNIPVMAGALEGDVFIGPKAEEYRGLLSLKYPMEHSVVTDWNDMERAWYWILAMVFYVVPIYEGFAVEQWNSRIDVAGRDVTRYLRLLLRKEGQVSIVPQNSRLFERSGRANVNCCPVSTKKRPNDSASKVTV
uniref:Uncharacterized protein n=1 Tax=Ditylenchus dipsaci TaxID=166011 RepID=A0A915CP08_9BILA